MIDHIMIKINENRQVKQSMAVSVVLFLVFWEKWI